MTCKTCKATCKAHEATNPRQYWHVQDVQDVRHPAHVRVTQTHKRIPHAHTSLTCARPLARLTRLAHTIKNKDLRKKSLAHTLAPPCTSPRFSTGASEMTASVLPKTETRAQFAARLGVHRSTITRAVEAGRLVLHENGHILVAPSLKRWHETKAGRTDMEARHAQNRGAAIPEADQSQKTQQRAALQAQAATAAQQEPRNPRWKTQPELQADPPTRPWRSSTKTTPSSSTWPCAVATAIP